MDEYFAAVERLLAVVQQSPSVPGREKYSFFKQLSQQHGRTAVMLSGGAALGVYHVGVPTPPPQTCGLDCLSTGSSRRRSHQTTATEMRTNGLQGVTLRWTSFLASLHAQAW